MRNTPSFAVLVALLLSCAIPPTSSANSISQDEIGSLTKAQWDDLKPIRFGDPIETYTREQLASYKIPRQIEFLDELPKSSVMKILRRELRDREASKD